MIQGQVFRDAALRAESISVADLLRLHGRASWPGLLLVLAVLSTMPLAGVGTALSLPLLALAWGWPRPARRAAHRAPSFSDRFLGLRLGVTWSRRCLHLFAALYDTALSLMQRRWVMLRHPRTAWGWRLWIAAMALVIFLPLPLGNLLPGISLALLGLGWIYKDGIALTLSLIAGAAGLAYLALSVHVITALVMRVQSHLAALGL